jgi:hypothetical protein
LLRKSGRTFRHGNRRPRKRSHSLGMRSRAFEWRGRAPGGGSRRLLRQGEGLVERYRGFLKGFGNCRKHSGSLWWRRDERLLMNDRRLRQPGGNSWHNRWKPLRSSRDLHGSGWRLWKSERSLLNTGRRIRRHGWSAGGRRAIDGGASRHGKEMGGDAIETLLMVPHQRGPQSLDPLRIANRRQHAPAVDAKPAVRKPHGRQCDSHAFKLGDQRRDIEARHSSSPRYHKNSRATPDSADCAAAITEEIGV